MGDFFTILGNHPFAFFFFHFLLNKVVIFMKIYVLFCFCVVFVLSAFGLSSICYDIVLFVVLLRRFISVRAIRTYKTDLIN